MLSKDVTGSVGNKDCESVTESEKESSRGVYTLLQYMFFTVFVYA